VDRIGIEGVGMLPAGTPDSIAAALARTFEPEVLGNFDCTACGQLRPRTETQRIDGAPELLRIKLANIEKRRVGNKVIVVKNNNAIALTETLDLRGYQAVAAFPAPLKYRLKSVLCHGGGALSDGHWSATVVDPVGVNRVSDDHVEEQEMAYLRSNPQRGMQAFVLTYVRISSRGG
jgi:ubiquitin C-terminal hydrolase